MRRRFLSAFALCLALASGVLGAEPKAVIKGPQVWFKDWSLTLRLSGTVSDEPATVILESGGPEAPEDVDFIYHRDPRGRLTHVEFVPGKVGRYRFAVVARGKVEGQDEPKTAIATIDVQVTDFNPQPPGPQPPTPTPTPTPTPPTPPQPPTPPSPTPSAEPIAQAGTYRVLILHQDFKMSPAQTKVFNSAVLVDRLNAGAQKSADGRAEWRRLDQDTPILGDEAAVWGPLRDSLKAALAKPGAHQLPVIAFYQGANAFVYPFPDSIEGLNAILAKFGS
jgi:hypothetical protein